MFDENFKREKENNKEWKLKIIGRESAFQSKGRSLIKLSQKWMDSSLLLLHLHVFLLYIVVH